MAKAYECDKCHQLFTGEPYGTVDIYGKFRCTNVGYKYTSEQYNFCQECKKKYEIFLSNLTKK